MAEGMGAAEGTGDAGAVAVKSQRRRLTHTCGWFVGLEDVQDEALVHGDAQKNPSLLGQSEGLILSTCGSHITRPHALLSKQARSLCD